MEKSGKTPSIKLIIDGLEIDLLPQIKYDIAAAYGGGDDKVPYKERQMEGIERSKQYGRQGRPPVLPPPETWGYVVRSKRGEITYGERAKALGLSKATFGRIARECETEEGFEKYRNHVKEVLSKMNTGMPKDDDETMAEQFTFFSCLGCKYFDRGEGCKYNEATGKFPAQPPRQCYEHAGTAYEPMQLIERIGDVNKVKKYLQLYNDGELTLKERSERLGISLSVFRRRALGQGIVRRAKSVNINEKPYAVVSIYAEPAKKAMETDDSQPTYDGETKVIPGYITIRLASAYLGVSTRKLSELIDNGYFTSKILRTGRHKKVIKKDEVREFKEGIDEVYEKTMSMREYAKAHNVTPHTVYMWTTMGKILGLEVACRRAVRIPKDGAHFDYLPDCAEWLCEPEEVELTNPQRVTSDDDEKPRHMSTDEAVKKLQEYNKKTGKDLSYGYAVRMGVID